MLVCLLLFVRAAATCGAAAAQLSHARFHTRSVAAVPADVEGALLILDEAHNIEDVCREAASIEVDLDTMQEVRSCFAALR